MKGLRIFVGFIIPSSRRLAVLLLTALSERLRLSEPGISSLSVRSSMLGASSFMTGAVWLCCPPFGFAGFIASVFSAFSDISGTAVDGSMSKSSEVRRSPSLRISGYSAVMPSDCSDCVVSTVCLYIFAA